MPINCDMKSPPEAAAAGAVWAKAEEINTGKTPGLEGRKRVAAHADMHGPAQENGALYASALTHIGCQDLAAAGFSATMAATGGHLPFLKGWSAVFRGFCARRDGT
ncbi:hypothetical protein WKI45_19600 [Delftia tsuruhatensis]